jgi:hypothetical protein
MANEESLREVAHSRTPFSVWLGVVVLFAFFGVIVLATIGPSPRGTSYEENRAKKRLEKLKALREEDAKALTTYSWVDKEKQLVRIPIERAMELTAAQLAQMKPTSAGPIATPAAPPAQSPAALSAASPAQAASPGGSAAPKAKAIQGVESENRGQPAAATNPPPAQPGTQPGASATPAATSAPAGITAPRVSPSATPPGTPLPVAGKTPGQRP